MPRFNASDIDKYGSAGGGGFFKLSNDGDKAKIRFMYETAEDVEAYAVHVVEIDGRRRNVNCLREYNQPVEDCPFCRERYPVRVRLFLPVYNIKEKKVQIWERGKTFMRKLTGLFARYPDFVSHVFEVERNGEVGDMQTTYEVYEVKKDDTQLEDLPDVPDILGGTVLDKSANDMEYYIEEGDFPPDEDEEDAPPVRRRTSAKKTRKREEDEEDELEDDDLESDDEDADDDEEDEEEARPSARRAARTNREERTSRQSRRTPARSNKRKEF